MWRLPASRRVLLLVATIAAGPLSVARSADRVEMSLPFFRDPTHTIDQVDRDARTAIVTSQQPGFFMTASEGMSVAMLSSAGRGPFDTLVRLEVVEILDGGKLLVSYGEGAAAAIRRGPAVIWRPFAGEMGSPENMAPATTKQIQALPDVMTTSAAGNEGLLGAVQAARAAARRAQSSNNMKQLALAFHNFADVHNRFPPAVIYGPDGKPWHSWRVLLLPYLEQAALYNQYDFSQPWNAPANRKVSETVLEVFRDPAVEGNDAITSYAAIVGTNTVFPPDLVKMTSPDDFPACLGRDKIHFRDVTDGTSNTIMFATVDADRNIPWAKPEDIVFDNAFPGVGKAGGIGANHPGATADKKIGLVGFTDGSVRSVRGDIDRDTIAPFLTRNGGEVIDGDVLTVQGDKGSNRPQQPLVRIFKSDDGSYSFSVD